MATVTKQGKKWYAIYTDHLGKQRWKAGYTDKAETMRLAARLEDDERKIRLGDVDPQAVARRAERVKPVADHVTTFRAHMQSKGRHPNHIAYTCRDIELCVAHAGVTSAAALTLPLVDAWRAHCVNVGYPDHRHPDGPPRPDSRKTANRRVASVRAWLRYLRRIGGVEHVATDGVEMLHTKGHEKKRRRALTRAEVDALLEKCPDEGRRELYRFAIFTGFRAKECRSMTPSNFNFTEGKETVTVFAPDAKQKTDHQTLSMHQKLVEPLKALVANRKPKERIFCVPNKSKIVPTLLADCVAAGVDPTDVGFHGLRHTFCSLLAETGIRVDALMQLARHQNLSTTLSYYVHLTPDDERAALNRLMSKA